MNTYKNLQMLHSPFSIQLWFPLGTVKPCFVSGRVTKADPRTVRFDTILNFWATIVIQFFYILSEKSRQPSTLYTLLHSLPLCRKKQQRAYHTPVFHYSTQFHQMTCIPCCLFISSKNLWSTE